MDRVTGRLVVSMIALILIGQGLRHMVAALSVVLYAGAAGLFVYAVVNWLRTRNNAE